MSVVMSVTIPALWRGANNSQVAWLRIIRDDGKADDVTVTSKAFHRHKQINCVIGDANKRSVAFVAKEDSDRDLGGG